MPNIFEKELNEPQPQCCSNGACCQGASPSTPFHALMQRATQGDEFARNFFSIMVPYASHEAAHKVVPGLVERTLAAAKKSDDFKNPEDVVFYRCRYQTPDNKCGVHEDRPQFCRDYPDTPFVVMAPGCAFESWQAKCRTKYSEMKDQIQNLDKLKQELSTLKNTQGALSELSEEDYQELAHISSHHTANLSLVLSLTRLHLSSPMQSMVFSEE
ncbi:MAG: YkgJ family cysteine cluster protein [Vampirovibrio sp.]|nr:YkgJ family cysteine cluster protein [Vampirovibrio sp.]